MSPLVIVLGGLAFLYFVLPKIIIWLLVAFEPKWKKNIPGPYPTSAIVGGLALLSTDQEEGNPMYSFEQLHAHYGDMILIRRGLLTKDVVMVTDPKYIAEALSFDRKGAMYDPFRIINDNDVFLSDGEYWHRQRKLMNPMFSTTAIKGMYPLMVEELTELTKYLLEHDSTREAININDILQKVALDILTSAAFGVNYHALHGANKDALESMSMLLHEVERRSVNPIGHRLNIFANLRLQKAKKMVRGLALKCLDDRRNNPEALANNNDLLNMMIKAEDPETGKKMTEEEIISENVTFLVAGHETTAHSMTWAVYHLCQHPMWQKRLQEEVDTVLQNKDYPSYDDLSQMTVLDMVVKESMRLMSVAPGGSLRELTKDVQFGDYFIPQGTSVWVPLHLLNHNERSFADVSYDTRVIGTTNTHRKHEKFDPERFANNQSHYPKYLPFSAGPRNCIGQTFAKIEMRAVLCTLAKYFSWKLDPSREIIPFFATTQKPKTGLYVHLTPRKLK